MRILVILAHPHPGSFNHAIAKTSVQALVQNGHQVAFHDLYKESFDPILCFEEIPKDAPLDD
jgi:NAD(P)H dehydrogenase (quinone)